jgi:predicted sulfurtransferase
MERILADFEQTRDAPQWRGRCFVFDGREALDPAPERHAT